MERPGVKLELRHILCLKHGEPFREEYPKGVLMFGAEAFQEVLTLKETIEETEGRVENIEAVLLRKPMCCRLPPQSLLRLYSEVKIGVMGRCVLCKKRALGTPYRVDTSSTLLGITPLKENRFRHICFHCVVYRLIGEIQ